MDHAFEHIQPLNCREDDENPQLRLAFDFVLSTARHLFLTGKAGTGKTTFLRRLKTTLPKRMIVVAPTGVAALNAGGVTIHSFFQLSFGPRIPWRYASAAGQADESTQGPDSRIFRFSRQKIEIIKSLDLLVIDEISMVRADLLDGIDDVLRRFRNPDLPFGGVQLLMIGDLFQLAPVVTDDDRRVLEAYYDTHFFFDSWALQATDYACIDLLKVYRQQDEGFIRLLNQVRENHIDQRAAAELAGRYQPDFSPAEIEGYITLTTHNHQAVRINAQKLTGLPGAGRPYQAVIEGEFPEYLYPTDPLLSLKVGAQVMFCKNDMSRDKAYFNGKIGMVTALEKEIVEVQCPGDRERIRVSFEKWDNIKYEIDEETKVISEQVIGSFIQVPFKLAWAITIHKSQGLTFDRAIIDAGAAFAFGQVYVALSRCRTLEGMILRSPITPRCLRSEPELERFSRDQARRYPDPKDLAEARAAYQRQLLTELFDFSFLRSRLYTLRRIAVEHEAALALTPDLNFDELLSQVNRDLYHPILEASRQILDEVGQGTDLDLDPPALQRISLLAGQAMALMMQVVLTPLNQLEFKAKNKAAAKLFKENLARCRESAVLAVSTLSAAGEGFSVSSHLQARARVVIEQSKAIKAVEEADSAPLPQSEQKDLTERIKAWRKATAKEKGVPVYMVLSDQAVNGLVARRPECLEDLEGIKGIGPRKIEQYGEEFLEFFDS
jgi:hypothetical protein